MAHLISSHDPYHIHKCLGLLVLLHILYRLWLGVVTGQFFPATEPRWFSAASIGVHGVLSLSSLLLPLPARRNFKSPMIWPEFRMHSITFALRHVVLAVPTVLHLWPTQHTASWNALLLECALKTAAVVATVTAAAFITRHYGDKEKRTTNAMPYPASVTAEDQLNIKKHYTFMQFLATANAVVPGTPWQNFSPVIAIQVAPLMMTLVRKGIASARAYHVTYTLSLVIAMWAWLAATVGKGVPLPGLIAGVAARAAHHLRIQRGWHPASVWTTVIPVQVAVTVLLVNNRFVVELCDAAAPAWAVVALVWLARSMWLVCTRIASF
jgi:hypothetical protein